MRTTPTVPKFTSVLVPISDEPSRYHRDCTLSSLSQCAREADEFLASYLQQESYCRAPCAETCADGDPLTVCSRSRARRLVSVIVAVIVAVSSPLPMGAAAHGVADSDGSRPASTTPTAAVEDQTAGQRGEGSVTAEGTDDSYASDGTRIGGRT